MAIKRPLQTSECAFGEVTIGLRRTDRTQATRTYIDLPIEALGPCAEMLRQLARGLPRLELARYIANSAHARALYDLAAALIRGKFLGPGKTNSPPDWDRMLPPDHSLSVLHIGHAALLCRGGADSVLVDPWFLPDDPAFAQQPFAASDLPPIGAIFLTHEHWDHINPGFLLHYPPDLPIIVPKQDDQSALYPHYREYLALFGLTNVIELGHWERYALPDGMIVTAIPFRGEGSAEDQAVRNCYHIERKGSSAFVHVDSSLDSTGESDITDGTIARLKAELGPVDVLYATRRQELHFGHEVLNDLTPIFLGEDPRRIHSALENCYCPADYIADLARACGSSAVELYSEGGCEWFPAGTNFLRSGDDDVFLGQDYLWDRLEAFIDACPVPLHYSNPLDAVFLNNGAIDFAGPVIAAG